MAKAMGNGRFLGNHLTDFDETGNLKLPSKTTLHAKFNFNPTTWVVWANTQFATVRFLFICLPFSCFLRHTHRSHQWTHFDDLYVIPHFVMQACAFWWSRLYDSPLRGSNPQNTPKNDVNRHFRTKLEKHYKKFRYHTETAHHTMSVKIV